MESTAASEFDEPIEEGAVPGNESVSSEAPAEGPDNPTDYQDESTGLAEPTTEDGQPTEGVAAGEPNEPGYSGTAEDVGAPSEGVEEEGGAEQEAGIDQQAEESLGEPAVEEAGQQGGISQTQESLDEGGAIDPAAEGAQSETDLQTQDPSQEPLESQNPVDPDADPIS